MTTYTLHSRHWSQTNKWLQNYQVVQFGPLGQQLFDRMVSTRKGTDNLGAVPLAGVDQSNPNDLHTIGQIFEDCDGMSGYHYLLNNFPAWIKLRVDGLYEAEFANDYFVGEKLEQAQAWLFVNLYLEGYPGKDVDFDWTGEEFYTATQNNEVLWTCEEKREAP